MYLLHAFTHETGMGVPLPLSEPEVSGGVHRHSSPGAGAGVLMAGAAGASNRDRVNSDTANANSRVGGVGPGVVRTVNYNVNRDLTRDQHYNSILRM